MGDGIFENHSLAHAYGIKRYPQSKFQVSNPDGVDGALTDPFHNNFGFITLKQRLFYPNFLVISKNPETVVG